MNQELQQRIAAIKAECEEILKLSEKATAGPWIAERTFCDWGFPFQMIVKTTKEDPSVSGYGITLQYGGVIGCMGPPDPRNERSRKDAEFIAASRNVSPAMARVVLLALDALEKSAHYWIDNKTALEEIADQWEDKR